MTVTVLSSRDRLRIEIGSATAARRGHVLDAVLDGSIASDMREAERVVVTMIEAVRHAPDCDPAWTDDDICTQALHRIRARRGQFGRAAEEAVRL